ncbi:MAG: hypothetical protein QOD52_446 [Gaiellaceae bacterium]|jgi:hypothetical protein|nr:hypothetical protein [Gaiellaceae bacterium]
MPGWAGVVIFMAAWLSVAGVVNERKTRKRRRFIESYEFPQPLGPKLRAHHESLDNRDTERVFDALRQWFLASLEANGSMIGMPSRVVDDAWHEFILMTRIYHGFCDKAFGKYLHHTPNAVASTSVSSAIPHTLKCLRRAKLVPKDTLPTLFTIDHELRIEKGRYWTLEEIASLESETFQVDCLGGGDQEKDSNCCG